MPIFFFLLLFLSPPASATPLPQVTQLVQAQVDTWKLAAQSSSSRAWADEEDFEQFYLEVDPNVGIGIDVVQLQIQLQLGFLWIRNPPAACQPYAPN